MDRSDPRPRSAAWRDQWFLMAVALTLGAFVAAEVAGASLATHVELRPTVVGMLRLLTLLFALLGGAAVLERTARDQTARLSQWRTEAQSWRQRSETARAEWEERAHEARTALSTIELAAYAAGRRLDRRGGSWESVVELIRAEVAHLHRLLDGDGSGGPPADFSVGAVLWPAIEASRLRGQDVSWDIDPALTAHGSPEATAEIVGNLLDNAARHAPGAPVTVAARLRDGAVVIRVEDRGPGIDPHIAEHAFERGIAGSAEGSGLGLYIARRMATAHGGSLTALPARAGAAFELRLPWRAAVGLAGVA